MFNNILSVYLDMLYHFNTFSGLVVALSAFGSLTGKLLAGVCNKVPLKLFGRSTTVVYNRFNIFNHFSY